MYAVFEWSYFHTVHFLFPLSQLYLVPISFYLLHSFYMYGTFLFESLPYFHVI